jgi:hypothetical protein
MAARLATRSHIDFVMAYAHPGDMDPHRPLGSFRAMVSNTPLLVVVAENAGDLTGHGRHR